MSLTLRPYQTAALDGLFAYWAEHDGSPLIVLPTGAGKALVIAELIRRLVTDYSGMRILNATHVKELLFQNYQELLGIWPLAPAGLFSAGLGRRDAGAQILFGGVQTIASKTAQIGFVDLVIVDEAHLMPRNSETQYGKLLAGLREINPDLKLVGLTATHYRLGEGLLHEGDGAIFDAVAYEKPVGEMIDEGWLCRPVSKAMDTGYDLTNVGKVGGDFNQGALQAAVDRADVTARAVDEVVAYGKGRRSWLLFCSGVDHAYHVRDELKSRGVKAAAVAGETPDAERAQILADFKAGRIQAVTNNSVLTTGFNHPGVDLMAMMRPTLSTSLYIQMIGRGLRNVYARRMPLDTVEDRLAAIAAGPKRDCVVLDFAGNVRKHGPIDLVAPKAPGKGDGEAPVKLCPTCDSLIHAAARVCPDCGHEFPEPEVKIKATAENTPIVSTGSAVWQDVEGRTLHRHEKAGGSPSVRVEYLRQSLSIIREWVCPEHSGYARSKADRWWSRHGGELPFPRSVDELLRRQDELRETLAIAVKPDGRYFVVDDHKVGERPEPKIKQPDPDWMEEEIPF